MNEMAKCDYGILREKNSFYDVEYESPEDTVKMKNIVGIKNYSTYEEALKDFKK